MLHSLALAASLAAAAAPTDAQIQNVRVLLSPIEESPNYALLRQLPYARAAFEVIAQDPSVMLVIRGRAFEGIASYGDDAAFTRVTAAVDDASLPVVVRRAALLALGLNFQARALPVIERVLVTSDDVQFRRVGAMTLRRIADPAARDLARQALVIEKDPVVRTDLMNAEEGLRLHRELRKAR